MVWLLHSCRDIAGFMTTAAAPLRSTFSPFILTLAAIRCFVLTGWLVFRPAWVLVLTLFLVWRRRRRRRRFRMRWLAGRNWDALRIVYLRRTLHALAGYMLRKDLVPGM